MLNKLKPKSDFSRNVLTLMTGTTIAQAIPIAISPILTRIYTPEDFGMFALFIAITTIFGSIANGRYELAIMLPKKDEDAINIFALGFIITTVISLLLLVLVLIFKDSFVQLLQNESIGIWLYFVPMTVFLTGLFNILNYFNNRKKYYKDIANATIIKSIVLVIVQLSIGFMKQGVAGLIGGQIFSQLFANTKLLKNIIKDKILISKISKVKMVALAKRYKDFPKFQAPHAFINTFSSNIPIYLFSVFFNSTIVGFYALSTRIVFSPLMVIAGSSAKVYNQKVSEIYKEKGDSYSFTIRLISSLFKKIIIPFLLIVIFAPNIFSFIFGEEWREAGIYTQILSPWIFMVFMVSTISYITSLLNLQKKGLFIEIIYSFFRVLAILIGVYFYNVYIGLILFSVVGIIMLSYNMHWMLSSLKKVN
jgi:O-antigen/teichoic acid export membrane protein